GDGDADKEQVEGERTEQQPARGAAQVRRQCLSYAHGRAPVNTSGSNVIDPIPPPPTEAGAAAKSSMRRSSPAIPTKKPSAAQQASAATRGHAGANCQSSSTAGSRQSGCFWRGSGPLIRFSRRPMAASST